MAADMRPLAEQIDGFISVERFESLTQPGKLLSLSFWRDEAALAEWRQLEAHRRAQTAGRHRLLRQLPPPCRRGDPGLWDGRAGAGPGG